MKRIMLPISSAMLFAFLITGCSTTPSPADGQKVLAGKIEQQSKGVIKLLSFAKTNAQQAEIMGVKVYTMEYQAEIEFTSNCYWGGPFGGFEVLTGKPGPFNFFMYQGKSQATAGQRENISGQLHFEKTEKGWRGEDGQIY